MVSRCCPLTHSAPMHLDNALMHASLPLVPFGLSLGCGHVVSLHPLFQCFQESPWGWGNLWAQ